MQETYDRLYKMLFEIVSFFIRPKQDRLLLQKAGVMLDTALFPLLMQIAYHEALGIVELSMQVNRNYSTVSRQVDKLVAKGLVISTAETSDKRVRKVLLTDAGKTVSAQVAAARRAMMRKALQSWDKDQLVELENSLEHLVETVRNHVET
jgi:DNA-binding MarR family transcriptional regulator